MWPSTAGDSEGCSPPGLTGVSWDHMIDHMSKADNKSQAQALSLGESLCEKQGLPESLSLVKLGEQLLLPSWQSPRKELKKGWAKN